MFSSIYGSSWYFKLTLHWVLFCSYHYRVFDRISEARNYWIVYSAPEHGIGYGTDTLVTCDITHGAVMICVLVRAMVPMQLKSEMTFSSVVESIQTVIENVASARLQSIIALCIIQIHFQVVKV